MAIPPCSTIAADRIVGDLVHGASIAVSGVCLTVVGWQSGRLTAIEFDVMGETLKRSVIGALRVGDKVNLERAVRADARLDGHVVQGHVDGTGVVVSRTPGDAWETVRFGLPTDLARFVAEKGSIAVDGVSLTVAGRRSGLVRGRAHSRRRCAPPRWGRGRPATRSTSRSTSSRSTSLA